MNIQKIILTVFALIALFLVLTNGNAFNAILKTTVDGSIAGVKTLQGRG